MAKVGPNGRACGARAKSTGLPCIQPVAEGNLRCRYHGGKAPQAAAAAERRREIARARKAVLTYGGPVDVSPIEALLDEVRWTSGHVVWLRERVQAEEQQALVWGITQSTDKPLGGETTEAAKPSVWLQLYQSERRHLVDVCRVAIAAGIEERQVRMAERQGAVMYGVFSRVLAGLGLSEEQQALVPSLLEREIRALTVPAIEGSAS